jgi:hypothetical protein
MSGIGGISGASGGLPEYNARKSEQGAPEKAKAPQKKVVEKPPEDTMNPIDVLEISPEAQAASDAIRAVLVDPASSTYYLNPAAVEQVARQEEEERKKRERKNQK